jgi:hypothetical protein
MSPQRLLGVRSFPRSVLKKPGLFKVEFMELFKVKCYVVYFRSILHEGQVEA